LAKNRQKAKEKKGHMKLNKEFFLITTISPYITGGIESESPTCALNLKLDH
jgi:hypothetical protein